MIRYKKFIVKACIALCLTAPGYCEVISLESAIKETCANSNNAKDMQENQVKSKQVIREKWSAVYPTLSTTIYGGSSYGSVMSGGGGSTGGRSTDYVSATQRFDPNSLTKIFEPQQTWIYSASIKASQPLYTFGKVGTAIKVANHYDSSVQYSNVRGFQQLQITALDAYFGAMLAQKSLQIAERSLYRKTELCDFMDRNFKMGSGSKAELLALQADLKGQWTEILTARQNAHTATLSLCALMGRPLDDSMQTDTTAALEGISGLILPDRRDAVRFALQQRGDLKSLYCLAKANQGGAKIFKAMNLPNIAAIGSMGIGDYYSKNQLELDESDPYVKRKGNWSVGIALQCNFFDGFANNAKAMQYLSDARKIELACDGLSKGIEIEIDAALDECAIADSNRIASGEVLAAATESYELTDDYFKQGSGRFADLQLTEDRLRLAEMGAMVARYRWMRSRAALLVAMGKDIIK